MSSKTSKPKSFATSKQELSAIEPTSEKQRATLHPYSNSRLEAMNQCPTFGVVNGQRAYESNARAMALEAGATMHEVFAALRIYQLGHVQKLPLHASHTASRIFGTKRWLQVQEKIDWTQDRRTQMQQLAFEILHSSEWYDDPNDNIRTMTNMELCAITYIDEFSYAMDNYPIWVESEKKPKGTVGIEQTFDVVVEYEDGFLIRYIGTIDGLVRDLAQERLCLDENKTASRLDDGFKLSFDVRHQVTGYCAASTAVFGFPVFNARVFGAKIKPTNKGDDVVVLPCERSQDSIYHWARWLRHTVTLYEQYKNDYEHAPRYTHSCNRYFRPCSLIPFCADTPEGRKEQWEQMQAQTLSPSEKVVSET